MAQAIPLGAALSIESEDVVIDRPRALVLDRVLQGRSPETRGLHTVERPVRRDTHAFDNLLGGSRRVFGCEEVQHAQLVMLAE